MDFTALAIGFVSLAQIAVGILGNLSLLFRINLSEFTGVKARPTDLIVKHLTLANFIFLLCKGTAHTVMAFGQTSFLHHISCKLILYLLRVARGMSIGSTALLSIFQAITICPRSPKWTQRKARVPKVIGSSLGLCWGLQLILNAFIPFIVMTMKSERNISRFRNAPYYGMIETGNVKHSFYAVMLATNDVMCLGFMMWASGSMVFILVKHKQRVQHIHRSLSSRSCPETRATKSILGLVFSFVLFYLSSIVLTVYLSVSNETATWVFNANLALGTCFSALCPFLLMRHYITVSRPC